MPDDDRDLLRLYWRYLADELGLRDWSFRLSDDPPPNGPGDPHPVDGHDTGAMVHIIYGRKYAVLYISPQWSEWSEEEVRYVCVHELVHCHLQGMGWALNNIQNLVPLMTMSVIDGAFRDAAELATDGIAAAWSRNLPVMSAWMSMAFSQ